MTLYDIQVIDTNPDSLGVNLWQITQELDDSDQMWLSADIRAELRHYVRHHAPELPEGEKWMIRFSDYCVAGAQIAGELFALQTRTDTDYGRTLKWVVTPLDG